MDPPNIVALRDATQDGAVIVPLDFTGNPRESQWPLGRAPAGGLAWMFRTLVGGGTSFEEWSTT
jgi:hypothetical protein